MTKRSLLKKMFDITLIIKFPLFIQLKYKIFVAIISCFYTTLIRFERICWSHIKHIYVFIKCSLINMKLIILALIITAKPTYTMHR